MTGIFLLLFLFSVTELEQPDTFAAEEEFRAEAIAILLERAAGEALLRDAEKNSFICLSVDRVTVTPSVLASYASKYVRDFGNSSECACASKQRKEICTKRGFSSVKACTISIGDFKVASHHEAFATYLVSCGWPKDSGEVSRFRKKQGRWVYVEASGLVVL